MSDEKSQFSEEERCQSRDLEGYRVPIVPSRLLALTSSISSHFHQIWQYFNVTLFLHFSLNILKILAMEAAVESTRLQIVAAGIEVRRLRAEAAASEEARAALDRLMHLKARFCELTGEEYRKKRTRGAPTSADAASSAHPRRQKQPKLVKEEAEQKKTDPMTLPPPADSFPSWSPRDFFSFEVIHRSKKPGSRARVCRITTPHGVILTPAFVPVGTNAALKALDERHGKEAGVQLMFCNTYHLLVHPGHEIIGKAGGLHRFMNHEGALITDSGKPVSIASPRHADYRGCFVCRWLSSLFARPAQWRRRPGVEI